MHDIQFLYTKKRKRSKRKKQAVMFMQAIIEIHVLREDPILKTLTRKRNEDSWIPSCNNVKIQPTKSRGNSTPVSLPSRWLQELLMPSPSQTNSSSCLCSCFP
jgi:hypothetical protein